MLAVVCALLSSLAYAGASVLQQRGAAAQPEEQALKLGLLVRLLRHPAWMLGLLCDVGGYVLQFVALGHGPIVVVQVLLVTGLLFALPLGAWLSGRRLGRADWLSALAVCAGLGLFLAVAQPARGRADTSAFHWVVLLAGISVVSGVLVAAASGLDQRRRSVVYSGVAGVIYGGAAALTKTSSHLLGRGLVRVLTHWQPYVLVVFAVVGMVLVQSAFQAGALDVSLPTMTVVDPVVSIAVGALVFGEGIASSAPAVTIEVLSLLAMAAGVFALARAELSEVGPAAPAD